MKRILMSIFALLLVVGFVGCEFPYWEPPEDEPEFPVGTVWLDANISEWPRTATLNAHIAGGVLYLDNDKANTWPRGLEARGGGAINGNAWIFVQLDGVWYAATWEWLRTGQHSKQVSWVKGTDGHIHRAPLSTWKPKSGETYGFMVSTPDRSAVRTVNERSGISWIVWP